MHQRVLVCGGRDYSDRGLLYAVFDAAQNAANPKSSGNNFMTLLDQTINEYVAKYGEPEYRYFKKNVTWVKYRRKPGYHSSPVGDGTEVSKDEYDQYRDQ